MDAKREFPKKVLIVDDDEELRSALNLVLAGRGFTTEEAENGAETLEKVGRNRPDVILLDGMMPVMDGFEACQKLRENPETQNIPIIFCTAAHLAEIKERKIKIDDYIKKPFSVEELCSKIDKTLNNKENGSFLYNPEPSDLNP